MRDYSKISPSFWTGTTGRKLRKLGPECQLLALYLTTCHHANMLGLYYLPQAYIIADTGLTFEGACKGLQSLSEVGFCLYDAPSEWVFVIEMARFQILKNGEPLSADGKKPDLRIAGINKEYRTMPNNPFLFEFYEKYHNVFHLKEARGNAYKASPLQAPCKPLLSQEQEQEQEQEHINPPPTPQPGDGDKKTENIKLMSMSEIQQLHIDCIGTIPMNQPVATSLQDICRKYPPERIKQAFHAVTVAEKPNLNWIRTYLNNPQNFNKGENHGKNEKHSRNNFVMQCNGAGTDFLS